MKQGPQVIHTERETHAAKGSNMLSRHTGLSLLEHFALRFTYVAYNDITKTLCIRFAGLAFSLTQHAHSLQTTVTDVSLGYGIANR